MQPWTAREEEEEAEAEGGAAGQLGKEDRAAVFPGVMEQRGQPQRWWKINTSGDKEASWVLCQPVDF